MNDGKLNWNMPRQATEKRLDGDMEASSVSECGKDRYPSQEAAEAAIRLIPKKSRARMNTWHCRKCDCWHIGHWIKK